MSNRVLVTNDDGIDAEGINVLVGALVAAGYDPLVVAPNSDYSGAGGSLAGLVGSQQINYERRTLDVAPDVEAYAVDGAPATCVLLAMREAFGPRPALLASGINYGLNTGPAVLHSGTVSAALAASPWDVPALAISAEYTFDDDDQLRFDTAAEIGVHVLGLIAGGDHCVINLNVPCCSVAELAGIRSAPLAKMSRYHSYVESRGEGVLNMGYKMGDDPVVVNTDTGLVQAGFASISALMGISSVECGDLVHRVTDATL